MALHCTMDVGLNKVTKNVSKFRTAAAGGSSSEGTRSKMCVASPHSAPWSCSRTPKTNWSSNSSKENCGHTSGCHDESSCQKELSPPPCSVHSKTFLEKKGTTQPQNKGNFHRDCYTWKESHRMNLQGKNEKFKNIFKEKITCKSMELWSDMAHPGDPSGWLVGESGGCQIYWDTGAFLNFTYTFQLQNSSFVLFLKK